MGGQNTNDRLDRWRFGNRMAVVLALTGLMVGLMPLTGVGLAQGELTRVSVSTSGAQADSPSSGGVVSGNGRYVVFLSEATNLVPGDTNNRPDIFRFDQVTGQIQPVSITAEGTFLASNHGSPVISDDGRFVAFWTEGVFDTADVERTADVVVKDMLTGIVERVTLAPDGSNKLGEDRFSVNKALAMSGDARWIVFQSTALNLVAGDSDDGQPDLYVRDRTLGSTTLLSTEENGIPGPSGGHDGVVAGLGSEAVVGFRVLSPDRTTKRMVIKHLAGPTEHQITVVDPQRASFLAVASGGDTAVIQAENSSAPSVYDVATEELISLEEDVEWTAVGAQAFSDDLRFYVAPLTGSFQFRYVDRETEESKILPLASNGAPPNQDVMPTSISDSGGVVAFNSAATNLVFGDTNAAGDSFVLQVGEGAFADDDANPFEPDIEWLFAEGITKGCGIDFFCPKDPVTRAQMASFLVRALELSPSTVDAFTDDNASLHQADINALAEAGITQGCGPGLFCPERSVSRQEMASFLTRALELPSAATDFFTDDTGSIHEDDVNSLAEAGITMGCAPGLFCPQDEVLREQMAAFLHRALGEG